MSETIQTSDLTEEERAGFYKTVFRRRDVRSSFTDDPVSDEVLSRVLTAAHHAPSVGFMQPWNFIVIRSAEVKGRVHQMFTAANAEAAEQFEGKRKELYSRLKLEGIREAPVNLCVTCDRTRNGPVVLGRTSAPSMDLYSAVCCVQNLWLAARAEGLGVGWVSIFDEAEVKRILGIPESIELIAYLCLGQVEEFAPEPELQTVGWLDRIAMKELVSFDRWEGEPAEEDAGLLKKISDSESWRKSLVAKA